MTTTFTINALAELHLTKIDSGQYHYTLVWGSEPLMHDGGFASLAAALSAASADAAQLLGLQVSYGGIVAGTYTPGELQANAEEIAAICVERCMVFSS